MYLGPNVVEHTDDRGLHSRLVEAVRPIMEEANAICLFGMIMKQDGHTAIHRCGGSLYDGCEAGDALALIDKKAFHGLLALTRKPIINIHRLRG